MTGPRRTPPALGLWRLAQIPYLIGVALVGLLWGGSNLPTTSEQLFGAVLAADIIRPTVYGLALLIPSSLAIRLLRGTPQRRLRGIALALAVAGAHALLSGGVLALDRALPWPGLPGAIPPLVTLGFAAAVVLAGRRWFFSDRSIAPQRLALALSLGALASAGWAIAGALGTLPQLGLAVLEALANGLLSAVLISLVFHYDGDEAIKRPAATGLTAGAVCAALAPSLMAVRAWSSQDTGLSVAAVFFCLVAGALMVQDDPPAPRRAWWAAVAFFCAAWLLPLAFSSGPEGEWIPGGVDRVTSGSTLFTLPACLGLSLILFFGRPLWVRLLRRPMAAGALSVVIVALVGAGYLALGRPGMQPDTFFVVLADQPDTAFARNIPDRHARRAAVYQMLTAQGLAAQANLRALLDARGATYKAYYLVNGLEVTSSWPGLRAELARRPEVARVLDSPHIRTYVPSTGRLTLAEERPQPSGPPWGITTIGADQVWSRWNVTGQGIVVGAIGSGVDWKHPVLRNSYLGSAGNPDYAWFDPWEGTTEPVDTNGIGTHTLATAVGQDGIGVAPGARWMACRSLARDLGNLAYYLDCMQFLFAPFPPGGNPLTAGDPARGADIVDAAWLCPPWEGCDAATLTPAIQHLADAGQLFVTGAGNDGPDCGTIGAPGLAEAALTVGATDKQGAVAPFSSRGPILLDGSGRAKPDLVAPGQGIISALPDARYAEFNGTSMATSHVAGVAALIWSANPALAGDIDRTKRVLEDTARRPAGFSVDPCGPATGQQNNVSGYGVVDAVAAVQAALNVR